MHLSVCQKLVSQAKLNDFDLIIHNYLHCRILMINLFFLLPMKESCCMWKWDVEVTCHKQSRPRQLPALGSREDHRALRFHKHFVHFIFTPGRPGFVLYHSFWQNFCSTENLDHLVGQIPKTGRAPDSSTALRSWRTTSVVKSLIWLILNTSTSSCCIFCVWPPFCCSWLVAGIASCPSRSWL